MRLNEVKQVQIGITTRCNSHCRFCFREELLRAENGHEMFFKDNPVDLPFEVFKNIFKDTNLTDVEFCGNKGDAIFHPDFEKIFSYTINQGVFISLATNGSIFTNQWWYESAKRMTKGEVTFALDGLEDTHGIYRSTSFKKVFEHMRSFIDGGGSARWQFIVFKHNEHQLEEAKKLSKEIGCSKFITVISRYYDDVMERPTLGMRTTRRELHEKMNVDKIENHPKLKKYLLESVRCQWIDLKRVYVSSRGKTYPCCYISCNVHDWYTHADNIHLRRIKAPEHNIENNTLNEIIKLPAFTYIYDNVESLKEICNLHCTNVKTYKTKIRKEENL